MSPDIFHATVLAKKGLYQGSQQALLASHSLISADGKDEIRSELCLGSCDS